MQVIERGTVPDISCFGELLTDEELGFLTSLYNSEKYRKNSLTVLKDSITVLENEADKIELSKTASLSDEEWAESMKKMIDKKRGMNNG